MKKIVFAAQVSGLIALFPILVMLEMNHPGGASPANNAPSHDIKNVEETRTRFQKKVNDQVINETFPVMLKILL